MKFKKLIIVIISVLYSNLILSVSINHDVNKNISLETSIGVSNLENYEYVYNMDYKNVQGSYLKWKSSFIPIFQTSLNIRLPKTFSLNIGGFVNLNQAKHGTLNDYDRDPCLGDDDTTFCYNYIIQDQVEKDNPDVDWSTKTPQEIIELFDKTYNHMVKNMDWNMWSLSRAVLKNYYGFHIDIQKSLINHPKFKLGLGLGYKQDKSKWYDEGGTAIYDNNVILFPANEKGIELAQEYKIPYIILQSVLNITDKLELSAKYKTSFWASAKELDYHILRDIKFNNKTYERNGKYHSLDVKLTYKITDQFSFFHVYNFHKYSPQRTNMELFDVIDHSIYTFKDSYGLGFKGYSIILGLQYKF